jgi:hypothetical protein
MPAAPSFPALLNQQRILEDGFAAYFCANDLPAFTSRYTGDLPDARVEIMFEVGPSQGHAAPSTTTNTGEKENDVWDGTISIAVQTERAIDVASPDWGFSSRHEYRVALAQALMLRGAMNGKISGFTSLSLDYYAISVVARQGVSDDITEDAMDRTVLGYSIQYYVKPDAWPANTLPAP